MFRSGTLELIRSINPYYDPPNSQQPAPDVSGSTAGIDFPDRDGQTSNCLQFTAQVGRALAAYANLPPEINSMLGYYFIFQQKK